MRDGVDLDTAVTCEVDALAQNLNLMLGLDEAAGLG